MDFALLDLRTAAQKTYWVQLRYKDTPLYAGGDDARPCRVNTASVADPDVEQAVKTVQRIGRLTAQLEMQLAAAPNREQRKAIEKRLDDVERQAEKSLTGFLKTAIKGWENIAVDGKPLPFSDEALDDMAQPKAPLFQLAMNIAADMAEVQSPLSQAAAD